MRARRKGEDGLRSPPPTAGEEEEEERKDGTASRVGTPCVNRAGQVMEQGVMMHQQHQPLGGAT